MLFNLFHNRFASINWSSEIWIHSQQQWPIMASFNELMNFQRWLIQSHCRKVWTNMGISKQAYSNWNGTLITKFITNTFSTSWIVMISTFSVMFDLIIEDFPFKHKMPNFDRFFAIAFLYNRDQNYF